MTNHTNWTLNVELLVLKRDEIIPSFGFESMHCIDDAVQVQLLEIFWVVHIYNQAKLKPFNKSSYVCKTKPSMNEYLWSLINTVV